MNVKKLQNICVEISKLKQQLVEELPHYSNQALYFQNNEITTGIINDRTEIKIHLVLGQILYFSEEKGDFIDLENDNISEKLQSIAKDHKLELQDSKLENIKPDEMKPFLQYAESAVKILENFRMKIKVENFTMVHLWPHHFDFSVEWFSGNKDEQIGTGISPGDEHYSEPYIYMNPYPFNEKITESQLPFGRWHTSRWNGIKIELEDILKNSSEDASSEADTLYDVFKIAKKNFDFN